MHCAGIVLGGGKSSRMGYPKAWLPFGPELMLQRVVRLLGEAARPIVVVAAPNQDLPPLPPDVTIVRDRREGRGPLEGLAAGLAGLLELSSSDQTVDAAFATSCDVPLLSPAFVRRMIELFADHEIAVPYVDGFHHPLAAVYGTSVLSKVERLLADNRLRPVFLFEECRTRVVSETELQDVDPALHSLRNLNHPADYLAALELCGYTAPNDIMAKLAQHEAPTPQHPGKSDMTE